MQPKFKEIRAGILSALFELYKRDKQILSINANERSITHRFAIYIEKEFPGWDTDCEYNRDGTEPKELHQNASNEAGNQGNGTKVYPDIIVHKRLTNKNLIIIEAKKDNSNDFNTDKEKIQSFLKEYHYKNGLFIVFNVSSGPLSADLEWFHGNTWIKERIDLEVT